MILCVTIGWLVFRRILYGPGWWLLYLPLRLLWRFAFFAVKLLIGSLPAVAGSVGAKGQSTALEQISGSIGAKLEYTPTARGKAGIPTFEANMAAPSVRVGGGGQGAKAEEESGSGGQSMLEQVGEMAEKTQQEGNKGAEEKSQQAGRRGAEEKQETVLRERGADERPNPKKRMWEEPVAGGTQGQENRPRDEL